MCQKRPITVSKETYYSVKRDLLQCQKRHITKQNAPKAERPRVQPKQGAQDVEKDSARGRTEEIEAHETYLVSNLV
jgi:hypothetical protein